MKVVQNHCPSLLARARAGIARGVLAIFGVSLSPSSGRRLAAACATAFDEQFDPALTAARRQLQHQRERVGVSNCPASGRSRSRLVATVDRLQDAARRYFAETVRLERILVADAVREAPSVPATALVGVALLSEGYLTYTALAEALPDQPVALLLASLIAAPPRGLARAPGRLHGTPNVLDGPDEVVRCRSGRRLPAGTRDPGCRNRG